MPRIGMASSTFYAHQACQRDAERVPARAQREAILRPEIVRCWHVNQRVHSAKKVWKQLNREGIRLARCTAARLLQVAGLRGVVRGRRIRHHDSGARAGAAT